MDIDEFRKIIKRKSNIEEDNLSNYEICVPEQLRLLIDILEEKLAEIGIIISSYDELLENYFTSNDEELNEIIDSVITKTTEIIKNADPYQLLKIIELIINIYALKNTVLLFENESFNLINKQICECIIEIENIKNPSIESFSKKGVAARHKEHRDFKDYVFNWLDENMHSYKSMDDAAFAIADKVVPMKFRTVRQWITDWKKLRATGKT